MKPEPQVFFFTPQQWCFVTNNDNKFDILRLCFFAIRCPIQFKSFGLKCEIILVIFLNLDWFNAITPMSSVCWHYLAGLVLLFERPQENGILLSVINKRFEFPSIKAFMEFSLTGLVPGTGTPFNVFKAFSAFLELGKSTKQ